MAKKRRSAGAKPELVQAGDSKRKAAAREVQFKFIFNELYNPVYCNGAYGGISPLGELVVNFYQDRTPVPHTLVQQLEEGGQLGAVVEETPVKQDGRVVFVRYITTGVTMNFDTAKKIRDWLSTKIDELENLQIERAKEKA